MCGHEKAQIPSSKSMRLFKFGEPNEFDPSKSLEENSNLLPDIKFSSVPFQIEYSVTSRADKGWAPPETQDFVSCLFINTGR